MYSLFSGSRYTTDGVPNLGYGPNHEGIIFRLPSTTRVPSSVKNVSTVSGNSTTHLRPYPHSFRNIITFAFTIYIPFKINFVSSFPCLSWISFNIANLRCQPRVTRYKQELRSLDSFGYLLPRSRRYTTGLTLIASFVLFRRVCEFSSFFFGLSEPTSVFQKWWHGTKQLAN